MAIFSLAGLEFLFSWVHFLAGVCWIGLLYYLNFAQAPYFKEADPAAKTNAVKFLLPRVLWWFRWAALFTFLSGAAILIKRYDVGVYTSSWGTLILIGSLLGTIMFLNVWLVIWPNQKIVIAAANGQNIGDAAKAGAAALLASRSNVMFSIPMLFFMGGASRIPVEVSFDANFTIFWAVIFAIVGALEINALKGKLGPLEKIPGVITCGFVLSAVLYVAAEVLL
jgi:uncharacterized membrane protein